MICYAFVGFTVRFADEEKGKSLKEFAPPLTVSDIVDHAILRKLVEQEDELICTPDSGCDYGADGNYKKKSYFAT